MGSIFENTDWLKAFTDRGDAGKQLGLTLRRYIIENPLVIALPLGGVAIAVEVSRELNAPLDVVVGDRGDRMPLRVFGRTVIMIDDGMATLESARSTAQTLKQLGASHIIFAAPVCATATAESLENFVDEIVILEQVADCHSVGCFFADFHPMTETEAHQTLDQIWRNPIWTRSHS